MPLQNLHCRYIPHVTSVHPTTYSYPGSRFKLQIVGWTVTPVPRYLHGLYRWPNTCRRCQATLSPLRSLLSFRTAPFFFSPRGSWLPPSVGYLLSKVVDSVCYSWNARSVSDCHHLKMVRPNIPLCNIHSFTRSIYDGSFSIGVNILLWFSSLNDILVDLFQIIILSGKGLLEKDIIWKHIIYANNISQIMEQEGYYYPFHNLQSAAILISRFFTVLTGNMSEITAFHHKQGNLFN